MGLDRNVAFLNKASGDPRARGRGWRLDLVRCQRRPWCERGRRWSRRRAGRAHRRMKTAGSSGGGGGSV
jgi:hypothetical protein